MLHTIFKCFKHICAERISKFSHFQTAIKSFVFIFNLILKCKASMWKRQNEGARARDMRVHREFDINILPADIEQRGMVLQALVDICNPFLANSPKWYSIIFLSFFFFFFTISSSPHSIYDKFVIIYFFFFFFYVSRVEIFLIEKLIYSLPISWDIDRIKMG